MIRSSVRDNILLLRQGLSLLNALDTVRYRGRVPACFNSSAGSHFRHVVEHYEGFFSGIAHGEIDYEARPRDLSVEQHPNVAMDRMQKAILSLEVLEQQNQDRALRVRAESAPSASQDAWASSSLLRELELLLSHTVHHYALIAITCRLLGFEPPPEFGMAPSTLRHRQAVAQACAR